MNLVYHQKISNGPGKVAENLMKGFRNLNIDFSENPDKIEIDKDNVICLQWNEFLKNQELIKKAVIGPNICVLPIDNQVVMQQEYKKLIVPSEWVKKLYSKWIKEEKMVVWPVGIDTQLFSDKSKENKDFDCLIYFKRRGIEDLNIIKEFLKNKGQTFNVIEYGKYNEQQFIDLISKSRYGIVIDNTESQGIAIQEMMSCNLPLLVWDVTTWNDRGAEFSCEATSIPFWSDECGEKFINKEEIENCFNNFIKSIEKYNPRNFIIKNLSLEKQAFEMSNIFKKKVFFELRTAFNVGNKKGVSNGKERTEQYINGLKKFFSYSFYENKNLNVTTFLCDNTTENKEEIDIEIINIIPSNVNYILKKKNNFGQFNKGAGLIEFWRENREELKKNDWVMYFEPRLILNSPDFINSFLENPKNMFTYNADSNHFNTGIFSIKTSDLLRFEESINLFDMVNNFWSIEDLLYKFFLKENIEFYTFDKMGVTWHNAFNNEKINM